jgi:hypothetical protein
LSEYSVCFGDSFISSPLDSGVFRSEAREKQQQQDRQSRTGTLLDYMRDHKPTTCLIVEKSPLRSKSPRQGF